jgi:succinate dehydrogenase / fumarate reductase, cytochrome b subunit
MPINFAKELAPIGGVSILKKIVLASSGLILIAFTVFHLLGNLLIFADTPNLLNLYANKLESLGILRWILELFLLAAFGVHIFYAIAISRQNTQAKGKISQHLKSGSNRQQQSIFSRSMIYTGPLLLLFILIHLKTLRFGAGILDGYAIDINGRSIRNLQRLITEKFHQPLDVGFYILMMIPLGFHLRHGFKSAWQSLGIDARNRGLFDRVSLVISIGLSLGFAIVPILVYLH